VGTERGPRPAQLNVAVFLSQRMPQLWAWCLAGQLDPYLATLVADQARHLLGNELDHLRLGERLTVFLAKRLRHYDDGPDGVGVPVVGVTAKQQRAAGDPRMVAQLKADLAIDLLTGTADATGEGVPVPAYARPIINVTVPIQTLLGIADDPSTLSGGRVIPAGLARRIAAEPGATWYRMLTDPAGQPLELSTRSYTPTAPIWRQVVAEQTSCYRPQCDRLATGCELDHRTPWPQGPTGTTNLQPACKADHKAKHAAGFSIEQTEAGSLVLTTAAGFQHPAQPAEQPVSSHWPEVPEIQFTASELVLALQELRDRHDIREAERAALEWERTLDASLRRLLRV